MQRTQYIAIVALVIVVAGLAAGRVSRDTSTITPAATAPEASTPQATPQGAATPLENTTTQPAAATAPPDTVPDRLGPAPDLEGVDGWLQTDASSFAHFDGQVRIVQFWTFGCYNCTNTLPHLADIYAAHHGDGLEIIGVHAPEFDYEKDPDAIAAAAVDLGVTWPIALDTEKRNFRSWQPGRRFWPRTFVIDQNGEIRFDRIGEGAYDELEATVAHLLEFGP